jgi:PhoPQ-activated pathogenicity-related protein
MLNASGDQFFLPDSAQFYFGQLPGPKYLRYVPNADHSLKGSDAYDTLLAWHDAILRKRSLPRFNWTHAAPGQVEVRTEDRPVEARLWQATNPNARDFRLETLGPVWQSTTLAASEDSRYQIQVTRPDKGWTAYFVEVTYDIGGPARLKLTTDVRVTPDSLPFEEPKSGRTQ